MHPDKKPNQDIVNADLPLRQATRRYQANVAIIENEESHDQPEHEEPNFKDEEVSDDLFVDTEKIQSDEITPSTGMENVNSSAPTNNWFSMFEASSSSNGEEEY